MYVSILRNPGNMSAPAGAGLSGYISPKGLRAILYLGPRYSIALNPFGEMYPDRPAPAGADMFPGFRKILTYIYAGGAFITLGGNPFHYAWDVSSGTRRDTSVAVSNVLVGYQEVRAQEGERPVMRPVITTVVQRLLLEGSF